MKTVRTGVWLAAVVAAISAATAASAQESIAPNAQTFEFSVCNRAGSTASVALSALYAPGSKDYIVAGWWQVAAGACRKIGTYPRGHFYTHATASKGSWGRGDLKLCVETPGPFKRINLAGTKCAASLLRPFTHMDVQKPTYELTLNP